MWTFCFTCFNQKKNKFLSLSVGSTFLEISKTQLGKFPVNMPESMKEQKAIAKVLNDVDALVVALEKLIDKKKMIKKGMMQKLLTGKYSLSKFKKTSIGYIPKDWSIVKLGDVADPMDPWSFTGGPFGSNLKSSDYTSKGIRVIQLQNIGDGIFHNDYKIFTSDIKANQLKSCNIYPGDIILSKMGDPVARACIIPKTHSRYLMCSDGIRLNINKSRYNAYFIYSKINSFDFRVKAESLSTGSTRKRINLSKLRNINLLLPPLKEQQTIAEVLNDMDCEINALKAKLKKIKKIKKGMMQQLLTGRIRLI